MKKSVFYILFLVAADQATKFLAQKFLASAQEPLKVLPFLNLVYLRNRGAAFGTMQGVGNGFFIAISMLAVVFVFFLLFKDRGRPLGLVLVLAGALGNMLDRFLYGSVRDFIDFYAGRYHWPAFNLADSYLTVGIGLLFIGSLFRKKDTTQAGFISS
jgi:signal peptidase II